MDRTQELADAWQMSEQDYHLGHLGLADHVREVAQIRQVAVTEGIFSEVVKRLAEGKMKALHADARTAAWLMSSLAKAKSG